MRLFILSEGLLVTLMVSLMQTQDIKDCEERCREVEKESRSLCNSFCVAQLSSLPVSAFLNGHYGHSRLPYGEDQHYAREGRFPFMASLKFKVGRGMTARHFVHFCGGSAISTIYILTAAHCVVSIDMDKIERLWVSIGDHDTRVVDTNEWIVQADKIIIHISYDPNNFNNDIALVKLKTPFIIHNHRQIIPRMPDPMTLERAIRGGSQVTTTQIGWRRLRRIQPILSYVDLPYVGVEYCKSAMRPLSISDNMLCSGFHKFGSKECAGISGGPLVYRTNPGVAPRNNNETLPLSGQSRDTSIIADHDMVLAGLVTWVGCGKPGLSVYTNVASYAEWIENNMKYN